MKHFLLALAFLCFISASFASEATPFPLTDIFIKGNAPGVGDVSARIKAKNDKESNLATIQSIVVELGRETVELDPKLFADIKGANLHSTDLISGGAPGWVVLRINYKTYDMNRGEVVHGIPRPRVEYLFIDGKLKNRTRYTLNKEKRHTWTVYEESPDDLSLIRTYAAAMSNRVINMIPK